MTAILHFTRNVITKVRSGHTAHMSDMLGNPMVHTEIMMSLLFYKNDINLLFHLAQIAGHLEFY